MSSSPERVLARPVPVDELRQLSPAESDNDDDDEGVGGDICGGSVFQGGETRKHAAGATAFRDVHAQT